jgi:hypothetical protein
VAERPGLEARVAGGEGLVEQQDVGLEPGGDGESQAHDHTRAVMLDRHVHEALELGELDDARQQSVDLARRAAEKLVGIVPGSLFYADGRGADTVRLSFSMVDESQIDDGIARLAALL